MKQKIITDPTILKQKSEIVDKGRASGIFSILDDSLDLSKGCGLTAIQIGINLQVGIIRLPRCKLNLWNPKIIEKSQPFRFKQEGCLSFPGIHVNTKRYFDVVIVNGDGRKYALTGLEAIVCQHEIAHMNGRTIFDDKWRKQR